MENSRVMFQEARKELEYQKQMKTDKPGSISRQPAGMQAGGNESVPALI